MKNKIKTIGDLAGSAIKAVFKIFRINALLKNKLIAGGVYDTLCSGYCVRNNSNESLVLFSNDQAVSRGTFVEGEFDFWKLKKALDLLPVDRPDTLLNIGANIGMICIPSVTRGYFQKFIAIEPDPDNFRLLEINTKINELDLKSTLIKSAVGHKKDVIKLIRSKTNRGAHKVAHQEGEELENNWISVNIDTLQSLISDLNLDTTFVVLDVEGYEGYVFAGAGEVLKNSPPMMIEFSPMQLSDESYNLLRDGLLSYNYSYWYNISDEKPSAERITKDSLDKLRADLLRMRSMTDILVIK